MANRLARSFAEEVDYWTGRLTMAIGAGKFRDEVSIMLAATQQEAYGRGVRSATAPRPASASMEGLIAGATLWVGLTEGKEGNDARPL